MVWFLADVWKCFPEWAISEVTNWVTTSRYRAVVYPRSTGSGTTLNLNLNWAGQPFMIHILFSCHVLFTIINNPVLVSGCSRYSDYVTKGLSNWICLYQLGYFLTHNPFAKYLKCLLVVIANMYSAVARKARNFTQCSWLLVLITVYILW